MTEVSEAIDLVFDSNYRGLRDSIAEKYFGARGKARDACLFALAVGIKFNKRIPRTDWTSEKVLSWSDLNRLKSEIGDFETLFHYMGLDDEGISTKEIMDEFVTGGLSFIDDNDLAEDGQLCELA